jgi:5'-phosphate synthase pdxT subunit
VPTIGVLALQGDVAEHMRALTACDASAVAVRRPEELEHVDALVIPGGESTTMWKLARTFDLLGPLRKRIEGGMPAYGSCAGMIMLADRILGGIEGQETIGGIDMVVRRNAFGRQIDSFESDVAFGGPDRPPGESPLRAVFIRAPWVERRGPAVEVLSSYGEHPVAIREGSVLASAFHPELTDDPRFHAIFMAMTTGASERKEEATHG